MIEPTLTAHIDRALDANTSMNGDFMPLPVQPGRSHNTSRRNAEPAPIAVGLHLRAAAIFGATAFAVSAVLRQFGFNAAEVRLPTALVIACVITAIVEVVIARNDKPDAA